MKNGNALKKNKKLSSVPRSYPQSERKNRTATKQGCSSLLAQSMPSSRRHSCKLLLVWKRRQNLMFPRFLLPTTSCFKLSFRGCAAFFTTRYREVSYSFFFFYISNLKRRSQQSVLHPCHTGIYV